MVAASNSRESHIQAGKITCYFPSCDVRACHARRLGSRAARACLDVPKWPPGLAVPSRAAKTFPFFDGSSAFAPQMGGEAARPCRWDVAARCPAAVLGTAGCSMVSASLPAPESISAPSLGTSQTGSFPILGGAEQQRIPGVCMG